jgi:ABC transporter substrate binding protein (PQQ-dependent alcohol dehydrogenase system)
MLNWVKGLGMRAFLAGAILALAGLVAASVVMAPGPADAQDADIVPLKIGYLDIEEDIRYIRAFVYARIPAVPRFRPHPGAQQGILDAQSTGRFLDLDFELVPFRGVDENELIAELFRMRDDEGIHFFLVDGETHIIQALTEATRDAGILLFNVNNSDDALRSTNCASHLMHTAPSYNMLMDALTQYLVFQDWTRLLVLKGPLPEDAAMVTALERSAKRNGASIVDIRDFVLSNDPREREQNNIRLMTSGRRDYDVVFIADTDGEFGRYVPYQSVRPRPVVGTAGLQAEAWHWTFERHGAPQLNGRFFRSAGRFMTGPDWAAWAAVKAVTQASIRAESQEFEAIRAILANEELTMDTYKGFQSDFRSWNNQLRQNLLISVNNAVIARAPIDKFEHAINDLDTLGIDEPENKCVF